MPAQKYPGAATPTTTSTLLAPAGTSVSIADATGWPDGSTGEFVVVINPESATPEKVLVTSRSGLALTIGTRGYDGTSAATHQSGSTIKPVWDAASAQRHEDHLYDTTDAHDASAISYAGASGMSATDVEGAIDELAGDVVALDGRLDTLEAATPFVHLRRSATLASASGSYTAIPFDTETEDTFGFHDSGTNPSRATVPSGRAGLYLITAQVQYAASASGMRGMQIRKNGGFTYTLSVQVPTAGSGQQTVVAGSTVMRLAVGDYVEVFYLQDSGGALDIYGGNDGTNLTLTQIGS